MYMHIYRHTVYMHVKVRQTYLINTWVITYSWIFSFLGIHSKQVDCKYILWVHTGSIVCRLCYHCCACIGCHWCYASPIHTYVHQGRGINSLTDSGMFSLAMSQFFSHFVINVRSRNAVPASRRGKATDVNREMRLPFIGFLLIRYPVALTVKHRQMIAANSGTRNAARNIILPCPCGLRCFLVQM